MPKFGDLVGRWGGIAPKSLLLIAAPAVLAVLVSFGTIARGTGGEAIAAVLRDPLSVLQQRSPGGRPDGALFQSKERLAATGKPGTPFIPSERVLSTVRVRPGEPSLAIPALGVPSFNIPGEALPSGFDNAPGGGAALAGLPVLIAPGVIGGGLGGGGGGGSGGGGGGGGGGSPDTPGAPPPTVVVPNVPVAAVPEPATWVMMILGFGLVGAALRSRARPLPSLA